ncbi:DUF4267 domain-containing protein [Streptomyces sp. SPB162]|uniref:DUF4267 domain-containing protein n=1 Tax=Streptomyces sp. SPB162 TaxID=2940560 RepID=UPI00240680A5|nr:DUF4267 domain-containing protein [Streptomyces sp. SPB162]MDF9814571.1 hypothetical protein [Streptomyces sp. SPB162]
MNRKNFTTGLAFVGGLFILFIGLRFLLAPQASAAAFGVPTWPREEGTAFLAVKGVRDIGTGLILFALLLTGHRKALGWAMLAMAFIPVGDMVIVLSHGGPAGTAYGIHGLTAVGVAVTAGLLLGERRAPTVAGSAGREASRPADPALKR